MSDGARIAEDLIVVASLEVRKWNRADRHRLVSKEVNLVVVRQKLETVRLVPSLRNDVEGNLSANEIDEVHVRELLLQRLDHRLADVVHRVVLAERIALFLRAVATHRTHVDHARSELDERASVAHQMVGRHTSSRGYPDQRDSASRS